MAGRKRICAGNWKMHKTAAEAAAFIEAFLPMVPEIPRDVELVICPPFTALDAARVALRQAQGDKGPKGDAGVERVKLGAQNMHWASSGAFTGEISAPMLLEFGVQYVIIGHSERRQYFGETDESVRMRTAAALQAGLTPIVAVGETLDIRRSGNAERHVIAQTLGALTGLSTEEIRKVVIAYEPIWAIGTGQNCDMRDANEIMHAIRTCIDGLEDVPILYGGSVRPENITQYCNMPDIDGGLIGGASLDPQSFAALAKGAAA